MSEGLWYVKTPDGDVDRMTLEQVDEAFNSGRIDENVMVLPPDGSRWSRLGELAGIDAGVAERSSASPTSLRPVSLEATDEMMASLARKKSRLPVVFGALVAVIALVAGGIVIRNSGLLKFIRSPSARAVAAAVPPPVTATPVPAPPPPAPPPPEPSAPAPQASAVTDSSQAAAPVEGTSSKGAKAKQDKKAKARSKKKH
jgi:hypothetical protein